MKRTFLAVPTLLGLVALAPLAGVAEQMIPAGSLVQCMVAESKISSKTTAIGDPVLCQLSHVEKYGRSTFPWGSYLVGHFEAYKDPGHFVGKGWMELRFDRMVVKPDTVIPISARVVSVPKYNVDQEGKILGNGHPVKDTVEWMIPVLWPIDLINLPRRGPSPVLKPETQLTLKLMDDVGIPDREIVQQRQQPALIERASEPVYVPTPQPAAPQQVIYNYNTPAPQQQAPVQVYNYQYAAAPAPVVVQQQPQVVYAYPQVRVIRPPAYYGYPYGYPPPY